MTTSDNPSTGVPADERSVVVGRRGLPWWGAVLLALGATALGIAIDLVRGDSLTAVFLVFYAAGCVAAVLAVMQRGIFAAMVQPPLVLAVAVPVVVELLGASTTGGLRNEVIALALPLVNGFPTMAVTTAVTVALGVARIVVHRRAAPRRSSAVRTIRDRTTTQPQARVDRRPRQEQPVRTPRR